MIQQTASNLRNNSYFHQNTNDANGNVTAAPIQSSYATNISRSMTIDEMRDLHRRALADAEAKETELRLVLASRYRELVGSSDEVLNMQCRAKELDEMVKSLPGLVEALNCCVEQNPDEFKDQVEKVVINESNEEFGVMEARRELSSAPRLIHSCLDRSDVHGAATILIRIFNLIASYTNEYPLANVLSDNMDEQLVSGTDNKKSIDQFLHTQLKMVFLHIQTLPNRTIKVARQQLLFQSSSTPKKGSRIIASALSALNLLDVKKANVAESTRAIKLIDLYFDSKAKLIHSLINQMSMPTNPKEKSITTSTGLSSYYTEATDEAEDIISKIIRILQYDIILYPYQIFVLRRFSVDPNEEEGIFLSNLPTFDQESLKNKASNFLAAHLPLIRTKVKNVLVAIAGTTASRLGYIRQSLYDKTDGIECRKELDGNGLSTWDEAVEGIVDVKIITLGLEGITSSAALSTSGSASSGSALTTIATGSAANRKFSLWSTLFSNTFSTLVHSLLSTSFHSVHARVVATLRASLINAPALTSIMPHEAYRNSLRITTDLDASLKKVSDDAHELLVHAEERDESERRLRQSLYVQTCEIMGRLLNELRRMLMGKKRVLNPAASEDEEEAAKDLIVGRLCYLLKFRLTTLPTLLDPNSSPAVLAALSGGKVGMISVAELQSAFEITDDNDDGLISFDEAIEAMEGAFSGTHYHGAEMLRETMLLTTGSDGSNMETNLSSSKVGVSPRNLTLSELALLSAKGLRHDISGPESALGTIQRSLDDIIEACFAKWAHVALSHPRRQFQSSLRQFVDTASTVSDVEWKRLYNLELSDALLYKEIGDALSEDDTNSLSESPKLGNVSTHLMSYLLWVTSVLNQNVCPSDSSQPFPSCEYASAMGINLASNNSLSNDFTMLHKLRSCLLQESFISLIQTLEKEIMSPIYDSDSSGEVEGKLFKCSPTSLLQIYLDLNFVSHCFIKRNIYGFMANNTSNNVDDEKQNNLFISKTVIKEIIEKTSTVLKQSECGINFEDNPTVLERHRAAFDSCALFFSSLFGKENSVVGSVPSLHEASISSYSFTTSTSESPPFLLPPLSSSRRFTLLPIQAERSVSELQLVGNIGRETSDKITSERVNSASAAANAVSSGLGFLSSMLKKT